jgi:hypothetical protein
MVNGDTVGGWLRKGNRLIMNEKSGVGSSRAIQCRLRLGGRLNYY